MFSLSGISAAVAPILRGAYTHLCTRDRLGRRRNYQGTKKLSGTLVTTPILMNRRSTSMIHGSTCLCRHLASMCQHAIATDRPPTRVDRRSTRMCGDLDRRCGPRIWMYRGLIRMCRCSSRTDTDLMCMCRARIWMCSDLTSGYRRANRTSRQTGFPVRARELPETLK